jgi:hypothetical protein
MKINRNVQQVHQGGWMKKILVVIIMLMVVGCSKSDNNSNSKTKIVGYWEQIERDWSGDIDDMRENPYAYLEITDDRLFFYTESTIDEGHWETKADKYYLLEGIDLYYDYDKLQGSNWKEDITAYGGHFEVSFDGANLILTKYLGASKEDGYEKNTYRKIKEEDRLQE